MHRIILEKFLPNSLEIFANPMEMDVVTAPTAGRK